MDEPLYCLSVCLANYRHEIHGTRGPFLDVLAKFEGKEWDEGEKIRIVGMCNDADRAEKVLVARLDRIESMELSMM